LNPDFDPTAPVQQAQKIVAAIPDTLPSPAPISALPATLTPDTVAIPAPAPSLIPATARTALEIDVESENVATTEEVDSSPSNELIDPEEPGQHTLPAVVKNELRADANQVVANFDSGSSRDTVSTPFNSNPLSRINIQSNVGSGGSSTTVNQESTEKKKQRTSKSTDDRKSESSSGASTSLIITAVALSVTLTLVGVGLIYRRRSARGSVLPTAGLKVPVATSIPTRDTHDTKKSRRAFIPAFLSKIKRSEPNPSSTFAPWAISPIPYGAEDTTESESRVNGAKRETCDPILHDVDQRTVHLPSFYTKSVCTAIVISRLNRRLPLYSFFLLQPTCMDRRLD
jgi:hypothetical protein